MFVDRWSPRAFSGEPLSQTTIDSLFEAARWAPSSSNGQPWLFIYAAEPEARKRFVSILAEGNQVWARHAPLLVMAFARRAFAKTGKPNRHAQFDTGSAWVSVAFEARKLGLYAHGMAGFSEDLAYERLKVARDDYEAMAAIAIGHPGDVSELPPHLQAREIPSERKPLSEVARPAPGPD